MIDENKICITKKQASICAAVCIVLGLLLFIVGYFWGKQSVIDGFARRVAQESFNDQTDCLLAMQSHAEKYGSNTDGVTTEIDTPMVSAKSQDVDSQAISNNNEAIDLLISLKDANKVEAPSSSSTGAEVESQEIGVKTHYALVASFTKKASAQALVQRLGKRNIPADIKEKISKSASGKLTRSWFQVITKPYGSKQELTNIIIKISNLEKIKRKDIKII